MKEILLHIFTSFLTYLVPKKRGYWVVTSLLFDGKYSGSTKYLFEYIQEHQTDIPIGVKVVYVTNNQTTKDLIAKLGYPVKYNKILWTWGLVRAEYIITDSARSFLGLGRFKFIQLWHGTGYKNIGVKSLNYKTFTSLRGFLLRLFFRKMILVFATSEADKKRKEESFANRNVVVTGNPRNDIFFDKRSEAEKEYDKVILYAPTFRENNNNFELMTNEEWRTLNNLLKHKNSVFYVKRHPNDHQLQVPSNKSNIKDITHQTEDIQELLLRSDILITDYSGIATDFALLNKPIIFYTYDFDEFLKTSRSFYYDLKEILPGPFPSNPSELIGYISDFSWFRDKDYLNKYEKFQHLFHKYIDADSSKRVFETIIQKYKYVTKW